MIERTLFRLTTNNETPSPRRGISRAPAALRQLEIHVEASMSTLREMLTVDADGHVMEPADLWLRYLEPEFRDLALQIQVDADGLESLYVEGKPMRLFHGTLGSLGGIEATDTEGKQALQTPGARTYADGCPPGGYDPRARLAVMDSEAIDVALLYPTIGICWEGAVGDPRLATAYTRAYNRWIVDFCSADPRRLVPIAHITLLDPEGAVLEVQRARRDGCAGVYLSPDLEARRGRALDDPAFARFFAAVQDLDMPIALPRRGAREAAVLALERHVRRCHRRRVRVRVPGHRRDGGVHLDDDARHVRKVSAPALRGARGRLELDHAHGSSGSTTSSRRAACRRRCACARATTSGASA